MVAEKQGAGRWEEPSPGGVLACHAGGPGAVRSPANLRPPAFPDGVPGSIEAEGLRAPGVGRPMWALVGAGLIQAVTDGGEEDRYCVQTHLLQNVLNATRLLFYANKMPGRQGDSLSIRK